MHDWRNLIHSDAGLILLVKMSAPPKARYDMTRTKFDREFKLKGCDSDKNKKGFSKH